MTQTHQHIPGTLYPRDGSKPHLPTMCSHRRGIRRNFRSKTVLCYEFGAYDLVSAETGKASHIETAEGPMPHRFCEKHIKDALRCYQRGTVKAVKVQP